MFDHAGIGLRIAVGCPAWLGEGRAVSAAGSVSDRGPGTARRLEAVGSPFAARSSATGSLAGADPESGQQPASVALLEVTGSVGAVLRVPAPGIAGVGADGVRLRECPGDNCEAMMCSGGLGVCHWSRSAGGWGWQAQPRTRRRPRGTAPHLEGRLRSDLYNSISLLLGLFPAAWQRSWRPRGDRQYP